jgi:hypothetical protein
VVEAPANVNAAVVVPAIGIARIAVDIAVAGVAIAIAVKGVAIVVPGVAITIAIPRVPETESNADVDIMTMTAVVPPTWVTLVTIIPGWASPASFGGGGRCDHSRTENYTGRESNEEFTEHHSPPSNAPAPFHEYTTFLFLMPARQLRIDPCQHLLEC